MKALRVLLVALLALVTLNALGGGIYGLSGAPAVPVAWLQGSPFHSYFVPSLVLLVVVGGSQLVAGVLLVARPRWGVPAAILAGTILVGWIVVQVAIIGYVSWMQPASFAAGLLEGVLGLALRRGQAGARPA
jgi:hypothetical protein